MLWIYFLIALGLFISTCLIWGMQEERIPNWQVAVITLCSLFWPLFIIAGVFAFALGGPLIIFLRIIRHVAH